jgi:hypothetical protein
LIEKSIRKSFVLDGVINENVALTKPVIEWEINTVNKRPELQLFDLQSEQIEIKKHNFKKVIYPKSMLLRRQVIPD